MNTAAIIATWVALLTLLGLLVVTLFRGAE